MKTIKKLSAYILILCMLGSQTAFADSADLSDTPILAETSEADTAAEETSGSETAAGKTAGTGTAAGTAAETGTGTAGGQPGTGQPASYIAKPELYSEAAVLYDATAKQFLYTKNQDKAMYPASITKIMTVLLAAEKLTENDSFTFASSATDNLESGYTNVSMTAGDTMTVKDAMYAIMLKSACEVSNGIAEKVSGSQKAFAELMNSRAKELGCTNTSFRNASGLNDTNHYTTAHDMALIAAAAFANSRFRTVASTKNYTLPASKRRGSLKLTNSNKMLYSANAEYMEGIVGGKTGYTSRAGNTLVEVLDTNGHELVAVVMKSNSKQYTDAKALLTYGRQLIENAGAAGNGSAAGNAQEGTWETVSAGRKYRFADGRQAAGEWASIGGEEYYFGSDGIAATGWKQFTNGAWYCFNSTTGAMIHDKWVSTDGVNYYYLQSDGVMAVDQVINGMYRVNENGVYVEKVG